MAHLDFLVLWVHLEDLVLRDLRELLVLMGLMVNLVHLDLMDPQVTEDHLAYLGQMDLL